MKNFVFLLSLYILVSGFAISKRTEALIKKEILKVFATDSFTKEVFSVSEEVNSALPIKLTDNNFFRIKNEENLLGYYYVGQAFGKADYFDFIVIFDSDLIVEKVKILIYREDHGGEIGSKRWLKQFKGKEKEKQLKYQKDIAAISGATISAKALMREVNKLLKTINILYQKKQL